MNDKLFLSFTIILLATQKRSADQRIYQICDQYSEADIRKEMVGHMDTVVAVDENKHAGQHKGYHIFSAASLFQNICQHRQ